MPPNNIPAEMTSNITTSITMPTVKRFRGSFKGKAFQAIIKFTQEKCDIYTTRDMLANGRWEAR